MLVRFRTIRGILRFRKWMDGAEWMRVERGGRKFNWPILRWCGIGWREELEYDKKVLMKTFSVTSAISLPVPPLTPFGSWIWESIPKIYTDYIININFPSICLWLWMSLVWLEMGQPVLVAHIPTRWWKNRMGLPDTFYCESPFWTR